MNLSGNAERVLKARYLSKDKEGNILESPEDMFRRVARAVASADGLYGADEEEILATENKFFEMMASLDFLPNSPTLMNAGKQGGQLSACFVLPVPDSMEGIFDGIKNAALIHKSGGGTGFSFSKLRPSGSTVRSTGGVASGPVSFMKVFNAATEAVKQGGARRGANMGILRVDHPDIREFILCKSSNGDITNFNISVGITDSFMTALLQGTDYDLIDPRTNKPISKESAEEIFDLIVDRAWSNGEPGVIFLDTINRANRVPALGEIESTNPCGEQPLLPYESCNLGSINLSNMVGPDGFDDARFLSTIETAVHFLDNVIDVNCYPLKEIEELTKKTRKIGLGVMGYADMLLKLGIPYDSIKALHWARYVMRTIDATGHAVSKELAKKRGPFPAFESSTYAKKYPHRNCTVTTIAPTGTLSMIANCSSGIEPIFGYVYYKEALDGARLPYVNEILLAELKGRGLYSEELINRIAKEGTLKNIDLLPPEIRDVFVCAHDISPTWHIQTQAAFQENTDNAVSKTVNFPHSASKHDVREVFMKAYELGCKGVTVYRDGSRDSQVLNLGKIEDKPEVVEKEGSSPRILPGPRNRPKTISGITELVRTGCGQMYVTINSDDQGICEVFMTTGKAGGCPSQSEATARLISIALRSGVPKGVIIKTLRGIRCFSTLRHKDADGTSCPDAVARILERLPDTKPQNALTSPEQKHEDPPAENSSNICPKCKARLIHEGGCVICQNCGWSKCM